MFLPIDVSSGLPIYRQLMEQVRRMVAAGSLVPGERLPSVREISASLHINPLTVAKAYQELEHAGVVAMRRGVGVFVVEGPVPLSAGGAERRQAVASTAERLVLEAAQAGLEAEELLGLVTDMWKRVRPGGPSEGNE